MFQIEKLLAITVLGCTFLIYLLIFMVGVKRHILATEVKQSSECAELELLVHVQDSIINLHEDYIWRMQAITGVENPDSVWTYDERLNSAMDINRISKLDLRSYPKN